MIGFLSATENLPFSVAILVLIIIALLEGVGALVGASLSGLMDNLAPEIDMEISGDGPDLNNHGPFAEVLSWLRVGKVPVIVLIIVFLVGFGLGGLVLQQLCLETFGFLMPVYLAWIPAFIVALPTVRVFGGALNKIIPKDETSAVSKDTLIGRVATMTLGTARKDYPAQGKVKDSFGKTHYVMVEPDEGNTEFNQGSEVLLVRRDGAKFFAITNDNEMMQGH